MSTFTKVNSLALFEYCSNYFTTVALHYFNFCTKFIIKIYQTFTESQHMALYFSIGSAMAILGSWVQARFMTLFLKVFGIVRKQQHFLLLRKASIYLVVLIIKHFLGGLLYTRHITMQDNFSIITIWIASATKLSWHYIQNRVSKEKQKRNNTHMPRSYNSFLSRLAILASTFALALN